MGVVDHQGIMCYGSLLAKDRLTMGVRSCCGHRVYSSCWLNTVSQRVCCSITAVACFWSSQPWWTDHGRGVFLPHAELLGCLLRAWGVLHGLLCVHGELDDGLHAC
ncbi:hypothetical protein Dimus_024405, partial [Dionaea muscipula]